MIKGGKNMAVHHEGKVWKASLITGCIFISQCLEMMNGNEKIFNLITV